MAVGLAWVSSKEVLMFVLGWPEFFEWFYFGNDWIVPDFGRESAGNFIGNLFLLLVVVENYRSVFAAKISAVLVKSCWIMRVVKNFQNVFVADNLRIKSDLNALGMAGVLRMHLGVAGILTSTSAVARND